MLKIKENAKIIKPFLKWAGGKGQLLDEIKSCLPSSIGDRFDIYVEPFIGGGAVFFYIAQNYENIKKYYIYDVNQDLVNAYNIIKHEVKSLITILEEMEMKFSCKTEDEQKEYFYEIREQFNQEKFSEPCPKITAKLIFLNRTCFNGLYRVNRKGLFNVPFGKYKNPKICNADNLLNIATLLKNAEIKCADFEDSIKHMNEKTFVYFDPPYRPLNKTSNFTSYSKDSFSENDQIRLAEYCRKVDECGSCFLLSNSDPHNEDESDDFFERWFEDYGFIIKKVKASRMINCKASGRGQINELLITNY